MPDECRARCLVCHGRGTYCAMCEGLGAVCPTCRGMRWLRTGRIEGGTYTIERCDRCRDPEQEMLAIDRYLGNWLQHHPLEAQA